MVMKCYFYILNCFVYISCGYTCSNALELLQYFQRMGGCMRGEACRFYHSMEKSEKPTPDVNAFVLPKKLVYILFCLIFLKYATSF